MFSAVNNTQRAELEALSQRHKNTLTPKTVVNAARDPKSSLHCKFEWNNTKAAEAYRLEQAACIIRLVVRVADIDGERVRLPLFKRAGGAFRPIGIIIADPEYRNETLRRIEREIDNLIKTHDKILNGATYWPRIKQHLVLSTKLINAAIKKTGKPRKLRRVA